MADKSNNVSEGLYQRYRPKNFKSMVGQPQAVTLLQSWLDNDNHNHALLFTGQSGTGKTTAARILKKKLNCADIDFHDMNIADVRGIDNIRDIRSKMMLSPIGGDCRIWLMDEFHNATKESMEAMLKILEDTPKHVYFFLCTTHPEKLLPTIRTRCTEIKMSLVSQPELAGLVKDIAAKEGTTVSEELADKIAEAAEGSPRKAVVLLEGVLWLEDEQQKLDAIAKGSSIKQGLDLCRLLMNDKATWPETASLLRDLEGEAETIRYQVLGYATSCMIGNGKSSPRNGAAMRAYKIIKAFQYNFYDSKKAGLVSACWEVVCG